jgi:excisionase family DNA binding protein
MLTRREAAEYLAVPEKTLASWAYRGTGPRFYRVGRWTRYRIEDLGDWLSDRLVENGGASAEAEQQGAGMNRMSRGGVPPNSSFRRRRSP